MKPPTFAPAYVGLFPVLAEVAQRCGYALAVHGSLARDFDLVAIPWTDNAIDPQALMEAIAGQLLISRGMKSHDSAFKPLSEPTKKPHGRLSWAMPIDSGAVIDLSVMPRTTQL